MKAVLLDAFGGPETLRYGETPDPRPGPGEVAVRVRATALNHLDLWVRQGIPAYKIDLPHVLGNDISGQIAALGPGVSGLSVGARVIVAPGRSCWKCPACSEGRDNLCESYGILGANGGWGGYAEMVVAPAQNILPMPKNLSFEQAASFPLTFLTAWHMLVTLAQLQAKQSVLILGAGSGVGVAAVQIARLAGAFVIAASTSADKLKTAKALGADETLHLDGADLHRSVLKLTSHKGVDAVFEHVGPALFASALKCLRPGGVLVTCGATTGPSVELDLRYVFSRELRILGARMGTLQELRTVAELFSQEKLKAVVDRVFPLAQARQAQEHLEQRRQCGKVVLQV